MNDLQSGGIIALAFLQTGLGAGETAYNAGLLRQRGCSSVDRVLASEAKGRGFDPRQPHQMPRMHAHVLFPSPIHQRGLTPAASEAGLLSPLPKLKTP
jgi:hypothetical protein